MKSLRMVEEKLKKTKQRLNERSNYGKVSLNGVSPYILSMVNEIEFLEEIKEDLNILKTILEHLHFTPTGDNKKRLFITTDITNYLSRKDKYIFNKVKKWSDKNNE